MPTIELDAETSAIWHILTDAGKATESQLTEVYSEHERTGKAFTTVLYNYDIIKEDELLLLLAKSVGSEVVSLREVTIPKELIQKVTAAIARMYGIIPVREEDGVLFVAAKDPLDYRMVDELHFVLGQECRVLVAKASEMDDALDHFYPQNADSVKDVLAELEDADLGDQHGEDAAALEAMASNAPIVKFVDAILYQAIKAQASDIHFEPFSDEFKIRYRVDGALYEMAPPPKHLAVPVISRIKVISNLNIAERRIPQDGRIELRIAGRPIDFRVSTLPTQYGESVVLRVLDRTVVNLNLDNLGIDQRTIKYLREIIHRPNGIMIVTGPTGSGKTTTLYSCLKEMNVITDKLLTAEDPVEYDLEGIMQVQINDSVGMTFPGALRAFLRQDPDRIMVGEIRDLETASISIQASLTGHLVLSTLHTNDAAGAITRLIDMGVQPFLISSTLVAVFGQRLVRRVCRACRAPYQPEDKELSMLGVAREDIGGKPFYYGKGCPECNNIGYRGRVAMYEFLRMSPAVQEMVNRRLPTSAIRGKALEEGMMSMRQCGLRGILDGVTSAEEVLKYT